MANAISHEQLAQENWQDMVFAVATGQLSANPPLDLCAAQGVTYVYGAAAGTSPPAFTNISQAFALGSNALRGTVFWNTGSATPAVTTAASATILTVTFPVVVAVANLNVAPYIFISPLGTAVSGLTGGPVGTAGVAVNISATPTMTGSNCTGFTLRTNATLLASQGAAGGAGFAVNYWLIP